MKRKLTELDLMARGGDLLSATRWCGLGRERHEIVWCHGRWEWRVELWWSPLVAPKRPRRAGWRVLSWGLVKSSLVSSAALNLRWRRRDDGALSKLTIKKKSGRIQQRRTYGRAPRRTRG